jgi:hypothetical protein
MHYVYPFGEVSRSVVSLAPEQVTKSDSPLFPPFARHRPRHLVSLSTVPRPMLWSTDPDLETLGTGATEIREQSNHSVDDKAGRRPSREDMDLDFRIGAHRR